jgi:hypothetical protein
MFFAAGLDSESRIESAHEFRFLAQVNCRSNEPPAVSERQKNAQMDTPGKSIARLCS